MLRLWPENKRKYLELLGVLFLSDEAHFHLSGHVNKQNFRPWACEQPHEHVKTLLSLEQKHCMVCCWKERDLAVTYFKMMMVIG